MELKLSLEVRYDSSVSDTQLEEFIERLKQHMLERKSGVMNINVTNDVSLSPVISSKAYVANLDDRREIDDLVKDELKAGTYPVAIMRHVRERTGMSLVKAKAIVDEVIQKQKL